MPDSRHPNSPPTIPEVRAIDLTAPLHVVHGRLPAIDAVQDGFARALRAALFQYIHYGVQVNRAETQLEQHDDVMRSISQPSLLAIVTLPPLRGFSIVAVDGALVGAIVDRLCGADVLAEGPHPNDFSPLEGRIAHRLLDIVGDAIVHAWRGIQELSFDVARVERNSSFIAIADAREQLITTRVQLSLATGGGEVVVAIPYSAIEPVRDKLSTAMTLAAAHGDDRSHWRAELLKALDGAATTLRIELANLHLNAGTVASFAVGQILTFAEPRKATVHCGDIPLFTADFGALNGSAAIRVDGFFGQPSSAQGDLDEQQGKIGGTRDAEPGQPTPEQTVEEGRPRADEKSPA